MENPEPSLSPLFYLAPIPERPSYNFVSGCAIHSPFCLLGQSNECLLALRRPNQLQNCQLLPQHSSVPSDHPSTDFTKFTFCYYCDYLVDSSVGTIIIQHNHSLYYLNRATVFV